MASLDEFDETENKDALDTIVRREDNQLLYDLILAQMQECERLYKAGELKLVTGRPSSTKFFTLLSIGALTGIAGGTLFGTADKDATGRRFLGVFGMGVGVLSIGGAIYHFPKEQTVYRFVFNVPMRELEKRYIVPVYLPENLSDEELTITIIQQLEKAFKRFKKAKKQSDFTHEDEEAKDDTVSRMDALSPETIPEQHEPDQNEEEKENEDTPSSGAADSPLLPPPPAPASSSSSSSSSSQAKSDIDLKYGQVIKTPASKPGVSEHGII